MRATAFTVEAIRVVIYMSRHEAEPYEPADLPFTLDMQGPFVGGTLDVDEA